ncbi:MAG: 30S ribosomal protein S13 [Candidatus Improbicoccus devescovinae]|nr:MAG: 30S ribosomal protein S13 [Candidatus Improbicoccus devescovinae]
MERLLGVDLPMEKRIEIALTAIYGIGISRARVILAATGVSCDTRVKNIGEGEIARIREYIDKNFRVEGDLRREVSENIRRLMNINCYAGIRHRKGLPVRGQRTRTNSRTRRGGRKMAAFSKKK